MIIKTLLSSSIKTTKSSLILENENKTNKIHVLIRQRIPSIDQVLKATKTNGSESKQNTTHPSSRIQKLISSQLYPNIKLML